MRINLLKRIPVALFTLSFTACSFLTPAATPSAADIEKEEQAVYSFFVGGGERTVLILQDTSADISANDPQKSLDYIRSGLPSLSDEALDNFVQRNQQSGPLAPNMELDVDYILLSTEELSEITRQSNWGEVITQKYPGSYGYTMFSRVGFNNTLDQAVIYVGSMAAPLMGSGFYYLMEKENGDWVIKEQVMAWIS
jgi:hypothetical protein